MGNVADVTLRAGWDDAGLKRDADRSFNHVNRQIEATERQTKAMESAFKGVKNTIGTLITIEAARRTAAFVVEIEQLASKTETMRGAFERMAKERESNPAEIMAEIQKATRGTISEVEALTVANLALSSGIAPLYQNLGEIIQNTRSISTALGRNAAVDIERVISAINKQEQELLDELGIVARAETAYKSYAAQLGKTARQLTDLERRTAFAVAVQEQLRIKARAVGEPIDKAAEAMQRYKAAASDFKAVLGTLVATSGPLDRLTEMLRQQARLIKDIQDSGGLSGLATGDASPGYLEEMRRQGNQRRSQLAYGQETAAWMLGIPSGMGGAAADDADEPEKLLKRRQEIERKRRQEPLLELPLLEVGELQEEVDEVNSVLKDMFHLNVEAETQLAEKRVSLIHQRIRDEDALARRQLQSAHIQEEAELRSLTTDEKHINQLHELQAQEMGLLEAEQARIKQEEKLRQQTEMLNDVMTGAASVVSRLEPEVANFANAAMQLVQGDYIGAAVSAVHGLLDVFGVASYDTETYSRQMLDLTNALAQANQTTISLLESMPSTSKAMKSLQEDSVRPLGKLLESVVAANPNSSEIDNMRTFFEALAFLDQPINNRALQNDAFTRILEEMGSNFGDFTRDLELAFGEDATIVEAGRRLLQFRDAALEVANGLDPAERALRAQFDVQEIALRRQAQHEFSQAGGDPFEQRKVFLSLQRSIEGLRATETAALRNKLAFGDTAASFSSRDSAAQAAGDLGISAGSGPGPSVTGLDPVPVPWSDTVEMYVDLESRHVPNHWGHFVDIPDNLNRYDRDWHLAVRMTIADESRRHDPDHWGHFVNIPGDLKRFERDWHQTIWMRVQEAGRHQPQQWTDLVHIPQNLSPIPIHWSEVLAFEPGPVVELVPRDIVRLVGQRLKINWFDLIDIRDFEGRVLSVVQRAQRDRKTTSSRTRARLDPVLTTSVRSTRTPATAPRQSAGQLALQDLQDL